MLAHGRDEKQTVETECLCVKCFRFKEFGVADIMKYQMWFIKSSSSGDKCVTLSHALNCVWVCVSDVSVVEHFQTYTSVGKRLPGWVIQLQLVGDCKFIATPVVIFNAQSCSLCVPEVWLCEVRALPWVTVMNSVKMYSSNLWAIIILATFHPDELKFRSPSEKSEVSSSFCLWQCWVGY